MATGIGTLNPVFTGAQAVAAWPSLGIAYGGTPIPLEELKYWSVDLQEAYVSPEVVLQRHVPAQAKR